MKQFSSMTKASNQRDSSLDAVSGFLIIFMMYCHLMFWSQLYNHYFHKVLLHVFTFYMVWFFFKGGLFAKAGESQHSVVSKSFHRLIVPYIIFSLIGVFFIGLTSVFKVQLGCVGSLTKTFDFCFRKVRSMGICPFGFCSLCS